MSIYHLLKNSDREEIGIPYSCPNSTILECMKWALEGTPVRPRQLWFYSERAEDFRKDLSKDIRSRIIPLHPDQIHAWLRRGPFDSLFLPNHIDPNTDTNDFWKTIGTYKLESNLLDKNVWFWKPFRKPLRFFGLDHHHAVLWDAKQILRPLNIRVDFVWLCDGRESVNEAVPSVEPPFYNSLSIYKTQPDLPLDPNFKERILAKQYDAVITSHSIITAFRLKDLGLPIYHINSTRFGNEWSVDPRKHEYLVREIKNMQNLTVIHNNLGDQAYFRQFFNNVKETYIPSLCESPHRIRLTSPQNKFLIWDTRQVLLQNKSPFMKELYIQLSQRANVESQAILLAKQQGFLPEGFLNSYAAVIHIPYNVSTMSIFQQTRANVPIWVPSQKLLEQLWTNPDEPNELSWTMFNPGSIPASPMDDARNPDIVGQWTILADFYHMQGVLIFDSIEDLCNKINRIDYNNFIENSERHNNRNDIFKKWNDLISGLTLKK